MSVRVSQDAVLSALVVLEGIGEGVWQHQCHLQPLRQRLPAPELPPGAPAGPNLDAETVQV